MLKINDKVLFSLGDEKLKENIGIIIDTKDNNYVILNRSYCNTIYIREEKYIDNIINVKKIRENITNYYTPQIEELKSKLKTATSEEKIQERVNKYNDVKYRILKNCERVINCTDDDEFENRLKEISKLKNELYTIDLECGDIIRKENGKIKYDIRCVEKRMNNSLNNISDENIIKAFDYK